MDPDKAPGHHSMSDQADQQNTTQLTCNTIPRMPNMRCGFPACSTHGAALPPHAEQVHWEKGPPSTPDEGCRLQAAGCAGHGTIHGACQPAMQAPCAPHTPSLPDMRSALPACIAGAHYSGRLLILIRLVLVRLVLLIAVICKQHRHPWATQGKPPIPYQTSCIPCIQRIRPAPVSWQSAGSSWIDCI